MQVRSKQLIVEENGTHGEMTTRKSLRAGTFIKVCNAYDDMLNNLNVQKFHISL
jgi:hypothetical protein